VSPWQGEVESGKGELRVSSSDMANAIILPQTEAYSGIQKAGFGTGVREDIGSGVVVTGCCVASEAFFQCEAE